MELLGELFSHIYLSELVKPLLSETLRKDEEIRVLYRQYQTKNKIEYSQTDSYNESYWILTNKALINLTIRVGKIELKIFALDNIIRINKSFEVSESKTIKPSYLSITFSNGEKCELYPPEGNDELDSVERYETLVKILRHK